MSFAELRAFLLVVDEGSFLSAATRLGVSRTTLRRQVEALEARAGVQLLARSSKGVVLTDAGRQLSRGGRAMERDFGALLRAIREVDQRPVGEVRIHMPTGLHPGAMTAVYALLRTEWPGVRVRASFSDAPTLARLSDVDLVVWFGDPAPTAAWEERIVLEIRQRLLAHPSYLASRGTPASLSELEAHDVLAWLAPGEHEPTLVTRRGATLPLAAALATMNAHAVHEAAHVGLGIAWAPDGGLPPVPGRVALVPILDEHVGRDLTLRMAVPRAIAELPKMRVFLDNFEQMRAFVFGGPPAAAHAGPRR